MVKRLPCKKYQTNRLSKRWSKQLLKSKFQRKPHPYYTKQAITQLHHAHQCLDTQCSEDIQRGKDSAGIHGLPFSPADKKNFKSFTKKEINLITHHDNQKTLLKQNKTPHIFISKLININAIFLALTLPLVWFDWTTCISSAQDWRPANNQYSDFFRIASGFAVHTYV